MKKKSIKRTINAKMCLTSIEGESIENKVSRIVREKEPIKDGAPQIYTAMEDGVLPAYNIRTDRWDVALMAMDTVHKANAAQAAKRDNAQQKPESAEPNQQPTGDA